MFAKLINSSYTPNIQPYTYQQEVGHFILGDPKINLQFKCWDAKNQSSFTMELDGEGLPRLDGECDYEIEIKLKAIPKAKPIEIVIK